MDTNSITVDKHSKAFHVAIGGGKHKKCIGPRLHRMIDKWVINVLKE